MGSFRSPLPTAPARDGIGWRNAHANGTGTGAGPGAGSVSRLPGGRRRRIPHFAVGALLVVACALGFALAASGVDHRHPVLALVRAVSVGQRLTSADVATTRISAGTGVDTIAASALSSVLGQSLAVSLPAGALLTRQELGPAALPGGLAITALSVKPGQYPPDLAAGAHVLLVPVPTGAPGAGDAGTSGTSGTGGSATSGSPAGSSGWAGVVTDVQASGDGQGGTVVAVQLPATQATRVAALPAGQIDVVLTGGG